MTLLDRFPFLGEACKRAKFKANSVNEIDCTVGAVTKDVLLEVPSDNLAFGDFPETSTKIFAVLNGVLFELAEGIPVNEQIRGTNAEYLTKCYIQRQNDFREYQESLEIYSL